MDEGLQFKVKHVRDAGGASAFRRYRELVYGDLPLRRVVYGELLATVFSGMGGGAGLFFRSRLYPWLFQSVGRGVIFGRNLTVRHPQRIRLGDRVILDDNCVIDAKGTTNEGIRVGDDVFIGRNTILYCKNGNIRLGDRVNLSTNCQLVSSNDLTVGADTVIGSYAYLLSGGGYDYTGASGKFSEQTGFLTQGPLVIGENCWIGAGVIVLDAASVGPHSVVAAGAVVTRPVPARSLAAGVPARVVRTLEASEARPSSDAAGT